MRTTCVPLIVLVCGVVMALTGCDRDIDEVTVKTMPAQGCVPLEVELLGEATIREGVTAEFQWSVGEQVALRGARVTHTFMVPGTYEVALTVTSPGHRKTRTATIEVSQVDFPPLPGLYWRQGCQYQPLPPVVEHSEVKQLGKTSLKDLETRIEGRALSTSELVTHPLWRRPHTHTVQHVQRHQFIKIPLDHFHTHGFVSVGETVSDIVLFKLVPSPEPIQDNSPLVLMRMVDSWGLETVAPEPQALRSTPLAQHVMHYLPDGNLPEGLYFIDFKTSGVKTQGICPVALVGPTPKINGVP